MMSYQIGWVNLLQRMTLDRLTIAAHKEFYRNNSGILRENPVRYWNLAVDHAERRILSYSRRVVSRYMHDQSHRERYSFL
jgi:hypothetical protein